MHRRKSYLAVLVALALLAGTGAAHAAGLLGGDDVKAAKAPRAKSSGHRFTFERTGATYSGEAARVRRLPAQLEKISANPATIAEAIDDAFLEAFTDVGMPTQFSESLDTAGAEFPEIGPRIDAAGDYDGDGRADVLTQRVSWHDDGGDRLDIAAVRGGDGTPLWARTFTGSRAVARPAVVLGKAGVLVFVENVKTTGTSVAARYDIGMRVVALDGTGAEKWSRTWSGKVTYADGVAADVVGVENFSYPVGVLDADGGTDTDVLIGHDSTAYACSVAACTPEQATGAFTVITGESAGATYGESSVTDDVPPWPYVAPGLSPAGRDGVLFVTSHGTTHSLDAFSAGGSALWEADSVYAPYWAYPVPVGDVAGAGGGDVLLWSPYAYGVPSPLISGGGDLVWSRHIELPLALAGGGADGLDAVGSIDPVYDGENVGVRYTALDGSGSALYSASYLMTPDWSTTPVFELYPDLGDVNGDGTADAGHRFVSADYETQEFLVESGAVSGRTGAKLWAGSPGGRLPNGGGDLVALSFRGQVIRLDRIAGATGSKRWTSSVSGDELLSLDAADVNGDSTADVLVGAADYWESYDGDWSWGYTGRPAVLDGATGAVLWSLDDLPEVRAARTEVKPYALGTGYNTGPLPAGVINDCTGSEPSGGGTCFQLDGSERAALVTIADERGGVIAGTWQFTDDAVPWPNYISSGGFCGSIDSVPVPPGAVILWVFPVVATDECGDPSVPTSGSIKVEYS